jgi:hypothetical protein
MRKQGVVVGDIKINDTLRLLYIATKVSVFVRNKIRPI